MLYYSRPPAHLQIKGRQGRKNQRKAYLFPGAPQRLSEKDESPPDRYSLCTDSRARQPAFFPAISREMA